MSYEVEMPESTDTGGGDFLKEPGWYHFSVLEVDEAPKSNAGQLLDAFHVDCDVLAGDPKGQEKKSCGMTFWNPRLTDKNNGEMAKKKQARFLLATGALNPAAAKPGEKVAVDISQAKYRQFVAQVEKDKEGKYMQLYYAEVYHVDDPAVAKVPKSAAALALLPKELRRSAESFAKPGSKSSSTANGNGNGSAVPASSVDPSEL